MRKGKFAKSLIMYSILSFLVLSAIFIIPLQIKAQANLVEESDRFVIYSSNYFELNIPKDEGPTAFFDINGFGKIGFDFNYLSEYESSSLFMNSVSSLYGKGYSLNDMEWTSVGTAETKKTYVNFTRTYLDSNTSIQVSYNIFNQPTNISDYEIPALEQAFVEFRIKDWDFSSGAKGIALNLLTFQEDSDDYTRFGPYLDIPTLSYVVQITSNSGCEFFIKFQPVIEIITDSGPDEQESMFFANYNVAARDSEPADIWISVPKRSDIKEIVLNFLCYYTIAPTTNTTIDSVVSFTLAFITITLIVNVVRLKRRK